MALLGESNNPWEHRLGSRLESQEKDATEANWLIHGSVLHRSLIEIMRIETMFSRSGFLIVIGFYHARTYGALLFPRWAQEAEALTVAHYITPVRVSFSNVIGKSAALCDYSSRSRAVKLCWFGPRSSLLVSPRMGPKVDIPAAKILTLPRKQKYGWSGSYNIEIDKSKIPTLSLGSWDAAASLPRK